MKHLSRAARALLALALSVPPFAAHADDTDPCRSVTGSEVLVDARHALLFLCDDGHTTERYPVNLGQGGLGKRKKGDKKTPIGRYPLAPPRESWSGFTWFVPIGYPTKAERAKGYTGGDIGVHGPPDWMAQEIIDEGFATPWTDGCIMVRTTAEIEAIRAWALVKEPRFIHITSS
jgi:hypothetical protein